MVLIIAVAAACLLPIVVSASQSEGQYKATGPGAALRTEFGRSKYANAFRSCWEAYYKSNDSGKKLRSGVPYYPTEAAIYLLSAWLCTGEQKYHEAAVLQFEFAHSRENDDGLLITELGFNRDTEARQIYGFYTAYKILGDKKYLTWADESAQALIKHLPRRSHTVLGTTKTYSLFAAGYCKPDKPYDASGLNTWVDVNQNAELALAYTLLYFEPKSALHKSALAKDIVVNEMEAGLAIQDPKTGGIPIGDSDFWITKLDTGYGAYALFSWTWLNIYWKNLEWQKHIESAAKWLIPYSTGKGRMDEHYYPGVSYALSCDLWFRIPPFHKIGFSPDRLIDYAYGHPEKWEAGHSWAFTPFAHYAVMGIPPKFYLNP
jgi:hypothetical protein